MKANQKDLATRFLLGELSNEERREVELRFLSDNEFFAQILAAEDALLDDYLSGTLTKEEHASAKPLFESSNEQRQQVEFTKQLRSTVEFPLRDEPGTLTGRQGRSDPHEQVESDQHGISPHSARLFLPHVDQRISTLAWGVIILLFVLLGSWSLYLAYRQKYLNAKYAAAEQSARQVSETLNTELARRNQLMKELESERQRSAVLLAQLQSKGSQLFTIVTLKSDRFARSANSNLHTEKVSTPQIRIELILEPGVDYERYSVLISTFGGRKLPDIFLTSSMVQQGKLTITLPTDLLGHDDFKIELRGASANGDFEHLADYAFRLTQ